METMLRQREANDASFSTKGGAAARASAATAVSASTLQLRMSNGDLRVSVASRSLVVSGGETWRGSSKYPARYIYLRGIGAERVIC